MARGGVQLLLRGLMVHLPGGTLRLQGPPSQIPSRPSHGLSLVIEFTFHFLSVLLTLSFSQRHPHQILAGYGLPGWAGVLP